MMYVEYEYIMSIMMVIITSYIDNLNYLDGKIHKWIS